MFLIAGVTRSLFYYIFVLIKFFYQSSENYGQLKISDKLLALFILLSQLMTRLDPNAIQIRRPPTDLPLRGQLPAQILKLCVGSRNVRTRNFQTN